MLHWKLPGLSVRVLSERSLPFIVLALGAAIAFCLWGTLFRWTFDEGIYLVGAQRVLRGECPYRDFFSLTGPATYYLYALLMAAFGQTFLAARLFLCLEIGVICCGVYWCVRQLSL